MDLYLDAEWFIGGDVFLVGYCRDAKTFGNFYDASLTAENFQRILKGTTGKIYFYGPDIGILEKYFDIDIRSNYHCVNLYKVFRDQLPGLKNYKLASIEKLFIQKEIDEDYLLQCRLAGAMEIIKDYVFLLPCDIYRGGSFGKFAKDADPGQPNITAQMVVGAKFFDDKVSQYRMAVLMYDVVKDMHFDIITSVNGRDSKFDLAAFLARSIAIRKKREYSQVFSDGNTICSGFVRDKSVLIVDDVIYKGTTMKKAIASCSKQKPSKIYFLAFGKSQRFAY